jgi:hypothetical protein
MMIGDSSSTRPVPSTTVVGEQLRKSLEIVRAGKVPPDFDVPPLHAGEGVEVSMLPAYAAVLEQARAYEVAEAAKAHFETVTVAFEAWQRSGAVSIASGMDIKEVYEKGCAATEAAEENWKIARRAEAKFYTQIRCWLNQELAKLKVGSWVWHCGPHETLRRQRIRHIQEVEQSVLIELEPAKEIQIPCTAGGSINARATISRGEPFLVWTSQRFVEGLPINIQDLVLFPSPTGSAAERTLLQTTVDEVFVAFYE